MVVDLALYSLDDDGVVSFGFGNITRLVSGPEEALQIVAHHLFQTPGSNSYNRDEGGGIRSLMDGGVMTDERLRAEAVILLDKTMYSIRQSQSRDKPADSTITGLKLLDARGIPETAQIDLTVVIELEDGNSFQATFRET